MEKMTESRRPIDSIFNNFPLKIALFAVGIYQLTRLAVSEDFFWNILSSLFPQIVLDSLRNAIRSNPAHYGSILSGLSDLNPDELRTRLKKARRIILTGRGKLHDNILRSIEPGIDIDE